MKPLIAWRITVAVKTGPELMLYSTYSKELMPFRDVLEDPNGFHVGTKRRFCLAYYQDMTELEEGQSEILLKLAVDREDLQSPDMLERWSKVTHMGNEAVVRKARVLSIRTLKAAG